MNSLVLKFYLFQGNKFRIELIESFFSSVIDSNCENWRKPPMDYTRVKEVLKASIEFFLKMCWNLNI